jgi:hypothetical protein
MNIVSDSEIRRLISKLGFPIPLAPTISCAQEELGSGGFIALAKSQNNSQ